MLISAMAVMDLEMRRRAIMERIRALVQVKRTVAPDSTWPLYHPVAVEAVEAVELDHASATQQPDGEYRWRRHPQLLRERSEPGLADAERKARKHGIRGLYAAHVGSIDDAYVHFQLAVETCEIDLTEMPSFWQMPRSAILAAADAYESVGRYREASMVQARVRTELRPQNVVPLRSSNRAAPARRTASGG